MAIYHVHTCDGDLFIFTDVVLDPSIEDSYDAIEEWYENNRIMERYTFCSFNDITWGEMMEPVCKIITPKKPWSTSGMCTSDEESESESESE